MATKKTNQSDSDRKPKLSMEGGTLLESGSERLYWQVEQDEVIQGTYIRAVDGVIDDRPVRYHVVRTTIDDVLVTGVENEDEEDAEMTKFRVPKGTDVYINERHNLRDLIKFNGWETVIEVGIQAVKQKTLRGGKSVWRFKIIGRDTGVKRSGSLAAGLHNVKMLQAGSEDVPF